jgi:putative acetyltransferase
MAMRAVRIRLAVEADAEPIFRVHRSSVERLCCGDYSAEQIAMWLDGRDPSTYIDAVRKGTMWVAEGDRILGFVATDGIEVTKLFVAGDCAFAGVGRQLLHTALNHIAATGAVTAYLESTRTAVKFYEKSGFHVVGHGVFTRGNSAIPLEIIKMERAFSEREKEY